MTLMVVPSKLNLLRDAKPLHEIARNKQIATLVVDRSIEPQFAEALRTGAIHWHGKIEPTYHNNMVVIALDANGAFIASYRSWHWPHAHPCPQCGTLVRCECPAPEIDFDDCVARCPKCKGT